MFGYRGIEDPDMLNDRLTGLYLFRVQFFYLRPFLKSMDIFFPSQFKEVRSCG